MTSVRFVDITYLQLIFCFLKCYFLSVAMDMKTLHKSSTFNSFTTGGTHKIGAWFAFLNVRTKKASLKSSKSITLGM